MAFINDSCASTHGNVRRDSIFLSPSGEWKLGGFELLSNAKDDQAVLYARILRICNFNWLTYAADPWTCGTRSVCICPARSPENRLVMPKGVRTILYVKFIPNITQTPSLCRRCLRSRTSYPLRLQCECTSSCNNKTSTPASAGFLSRRHPSFNIHALQKAPQSQPESAHGPSWVLGSWYGADRGRMWVLCEQYLREDL